MSETIKVAVIGAGGRMGSEAAKAVEAAPDMELVGRFDVGDDLGEVRAHHRNLPSSSAAPSTWAVTSGHIG